MDFLSFLRAWAQSTRTSLGRAVAAHPRRWAWGVLALPAVVILLLCAPTAWAAMQLNYFNVISFPTSVTLEWSTASEVNLAGFDVQCKLANEPDSAFHEIGYVRAKGGPDVGALYTFEVNSNIVPGVAYCFRLKEITTDGSPGDVIDRCGYGPLVTPTPGLGAVPIFTPVPVVTDALGNPVAPTATVAVPVVPAVPTDAFGNPLPPTPTLFAPPAVPTDAFGSPLAVPQPAPTDAFGNPLPPTPFVPAVPTDAFGNPLPPTLTPFPLAVPTDPFGSPLATPIFPSSAAPGAAATDVYGNPVATPILPSSAVPPATDALGNPVLETPLAPSSAAPAATDALGNPIQESSPTSVQTLAAKTTDALGNPIAGQADSSVQDAAAGLLAASSASGVEAAAVVVEAATPTPAYIVVTATPTQAPVALAPVLTPLPTATPMPAGIQLASTLDPGQNLTQNLLIMLLCLTFTGAGGIGIVGLITSVMFMRSRSSQREFYERTNLRRRL